MFRNSHQLDQQRTAAAFKEAAAKYVAGAERWFDGSPGSVDRRVVACERLLHSARQTIARFPASVANPYIKAAHQLEADLESLHSLRDVLITGASDYAEAAPPGFREAHWAQDAMNAGHQFPSSGPDPLHYPDPKSWQDASNLHSYMQNAQSTFNSPGSQSHFTSPGAEQEFNSRFAAYPENAIMRDLPSGKGQAMWDPEANDWAVDDAPMTKGDQYQSVPHGINPKEDPRSYSHSDNYPAAYRPSNPMVVHGPRDDGAEVTPDPSKTTYGDPNATSHISDSQLPGYRPPPGAPKLPPGQEHNWSNPNTQKYQGFPGAHGVRTDPNLPSNPVTAGLSSPDKRWVTLESRSFVASNADALDNPRELAIRAHNHASEVTSTYSSTRSAAVCRAFVGAVVQEGRSAYRPPARPRVAAVNYDSIPPEAMFL